MQNLKIEGIVEIKEPIKKEKGYKYEIVYHVIKNKKIKVGDVRIKFNISRLLKKIELKNLPNIISINLLTSFSIYLENYFDALNEFDIYKEKSFFGKEKILYGSKKLSKEKYEELLKKDLLVLNSEENGTIVFGKTKVITFLKYDSVDLSVYL